MECSTLMTNEILTKEHSITYQRKSFFVRLAGSRKQEMREEANFDETLEGKKIRQRRQAYRHYAACCCHDDFDFSSKRGSESETTLLTFVMLQ